MTKTETIEFFEPGVYIKIDDVFTGTRKLARVSETGASYFDLDEDDSTSFPIYKVLQPVEVGNILCWGLSMVDKTPDKVDAFRELVDRLMDTGVDVLTYNRAAHWAFETQVLDFDQALAAGQAETSAIRAGRKNMDQIVLGV